MATDLEVSTIRLKEKKPSIIRRTWPNEAK